ncbi:hypothetical protein WDU94_006851 [Cyamophila willieti]
MRTRENKISLEMVEYFAYMNKRKLNQGNRHSSVQRLKFNSVAPIHHFSTVEPSQIQPSQYGYSANSSRYAHIVPDQNIVQSSENSKSYLYALSDNSHPPVEQTSYKHILHANGTAQNSVDNEHILHANGTAENSVDNEHIIMLNDSEEQNDDIVRNKLYDIHSFTRPDRLSSNVIRNENENTVNNFDEFPNMGRDVFVNTHHSVKNNWNSTSAKFHQNPSQSSNISLVEFHQNSTRGTSVNANRFNKVVESTASRKNMADEMDMNPMSDDHYIPLLGTLDLPPVDAQFRVSSKHEIPKKYSKPNNDQVKIKSQLCKQPTKIKIEKVKYTLFTEYDEPSNENGKNTPLENVPEKIEKILEYGVNEKNTLLEPNRLSFDDFIVVGSSSTYKNDDEQENENITSGNVLVSNGTPNKDFTNVTMKDDVDKNVYELGKVFNFEQFMKNKKKNKQSKGPGKKPKKSSTSDTNCLSNRKESCPKKSVTKNKVNNENSDRVIAKTSSRRVKINTNAMPKTTLKHIETDFTEPVEIKNLTSEHGDLRTESGTIGNSTTNVMKTSKSLNRVKDRLKQFEKGFNAKKTPSDNINANNYTDINNNDDSTNKNFNQADKYSHSNEKVTSKNDLSLSSNAGIANKNLADTSVNFANEIINTVNMIELAHMDSKNEVDIKNKVPNILDNKANMDSKSEVNLINDATSTSGNMGINSNTKINFIGNLDVDKTTSYTETAPENVDVKFDADLNNTSENMARKDSKAKMK